jgi:hypothetical protein
MAEQGERTKWGHTTFGGGRFSAMTDVVLIAGVIATVLAFIPTKFSLHPGPMLVGVVSLCFGSFAVRYLLLQRRG